MSLLCSSSCLAGFLYFTNERVLTDEVSSFSTLRDLFSVEKPFSGSVELKTPTGVYLLQSPVSCWLGVPETCTSQLKSMQTVPSTLLITWRKELRPTEET